MGGLVQEPQGSVDLISLLDETSFAAHDTPSFWRVLEQEHGSSVYSEILHHLTRLDFPPAEAKAHWLSILELRRDMARVLGRDVGLRTALCDYFLNRCPQLHHPVFIESQHLVKSERNALIDELTGLKNRRFFNQELEREAERSRRNGDCFSLLMADVDHFKNYNDLYGHLAGDKALATVAGILNATARQVDHVVRFGGEEFAVLLPGADRDQAVAAAERLREAIQGHLFHAPAGNPAHLTISIGAATFPLDADNEADLLSRADHALYRAKRMGRNRTCTRARDMREHVRYPLSMPAKCSFPHNGNATLTGRTLNISLSGMLLACSESVEVGKRVFAEIANPGNGRELPLSATTVRVTEAPRGDNLFYIALAFTPPPQEQDLITFIAPKTPQLH